MRKCLGRIGVGYGHLRLAFVSRWPCGCRPLKLDKLNLDIFWPKDESPEDSANLPDPDVIAAEIVEDLEAALA